MKSASARCLDLHGGPTINAARSWNWRWQPAATTTRRPWWRRSRYPTESREGSADPERSGDPHLGVGALDSEPRHAAFQRGRLETKACRGAARPAHAPVRRFQDPANVLGFEFLEREVRPGRARHGRRRDQDLESRTGRMDTRPLDHVAELADIAWPAITLQTLHRVVTDRFDSLAERFRKFVDERPDQGWDVFDPFAQRRHDDWEHVETIVQVLAER